MVALYRPTRSTEGGLVYLSVNHMCCALKAGTSYLQIKSYTKTNSDDAQYNDVDVDTSEDGHTSQRSQ